MPPGAGTEAPPGALISAEGSEKRGAVPAHTRLDTLTHTDTHSGQ